MLVTAGLSLEQGGELGKLRLRMANALLMLNKLERAADVLEVSQPSHSKLVAHCERGLAAEVSR